MPRKICSVLTATGLFSLFAVMLSAADTVATAVYARVGNGYERRKAADGSLQPEYYALSNGGRYDGTGRDNTVDRVTYPQVAGIASRLLARQNYHYAQSKEQAHLLIVLHWGNTIAPNRTNYEMNVNTAASIHAELMRALGPQGMGHLELKARPVDDVALSGTGEAFESAMLRLLQDNRMRDQLNEHNARVLGYLDDLADTNDIRRWAGGGDRFSDLITDVEESRYYIVISAYDFPELLRHGSRKLLWQVRVSVRSPGNSFDDSVAAMLKSASAHFGRDSGRLVRGEEAKARVELGDLQFLGEAEQKPGAGKEAVK